MIGTASDNDDDIVLSAEYALDLLPSGERRDVDVRLAADAALAALVRDWNETFVGLADEIEEVAPPGGLKSRIEAQLFPSEAQAPWYRRLSVGTGSLALLVGGFAAFVILPSFLTEPAFNPAFTADPVSADGVYQIHFGYLEDEERLLVRRDAGVVPEGRDQQVWLIPEGGTPIPVGTITDDGSVNAYDLTEAQVAVLRTATLAVSDEPDGGSPTGQPTGEVIVAVPVPAF